jgi:hypothetical protein
MPIFVLLNIIKTNETIYQTGSRKEKKTNHQIEKLFEKLILEAKTFKRQEQVCLRKRLSRNLPSTVHNPVVERSPPINTFEDRIGSFSFPIFFMLLAFVKRLNVIQNPCSLLSFITKVEPYFLKAGD